MSSKTEIVATILLVLYPLFVYAGVLAKDFWDASRDTKRSRLEKEAQATTRRLFRRRKSTLLGGHVLSLGSRKPNDYATGKDFQIFLDGYPLEGVSDFKMEVDAGGMAKASIEMHVRLEELSPK